MVVVLWSGMHCLQLLSEGFGRNNRHSEAPNTEDGSQLLPCHKACTIIHVDTLPSQIESLARLYMAYAKETTVSGVWDTVRPSCVGNVGNWHWHRGSTRTHKVVNFHLVHNPNSG